MTDEQAEALGRRWIAAGGGWRAGMLSIDGWRALATTQWVVCATDGGDNGADDVDVRECSAVLLDVPDLRDAATRGAALEVVRERRHAPGFGVVAIARYWIVEESEPYDPTIAEHARHAWTWYGSGLHVAHIRVFRSEAEALVVALEQKR